MKMEVRSGPPDLWRDSAGVPGETEGETAGGTDGETAIDSPGDTAGESDPPDTEESAPTDTWEVCWLGPDRDHSVCVPTVPYDASFGSDYDYPEPYGGSQQYAAPDRFVDLDAVAADLDIAPNFVLSEYMEAWKGRYGVLQAHHVDKLQAMRDDIGEPLTVTSGYRSPAYNASVGGVTYSRHQFGDGADLDASSWSVEELGEICEDYAADYVGLYEDGHTHCDWRDSPLDGAYWASTFASPPPPAEPRARLVPGPVWTAPAEGFDEGEPFRRWVAWGATGAVVANTTGRSFTPPPDAVRFRVTVGGAVELYGP